ncbi:sulfurtransferase complex subunit TusB [Thaumasiovibrio subtropicus]|uniref:sulfurtransferase complex subunit TusB n=1 Tax=Thaumasiovibrio subtropicus TaxID=1891207 RepID=UPI000B35E532|nr:sulfurtransferase complex subunit TusB [Thaumasiovibrio subtropicus]
MLHIVTSSPFSSQSLQTCLRYSSHEDEIILMQDAVFAALAETPYANALAQRSGQVYVYAPDIQARGVEKKLVSGFPQIDNNAFVALTVQHTQQINWQ